ncbi:putative Tetratricopeptide (TPR) repeat protein [Gammaproteobacteria bacterium]
MSTFTHEQVLQQAIGHHQAGHLPEAEHLYRAILQIQPYHPDANHNLGVLAVQVGQPAAALPFLKTALEVNPVKEQYWLSYVETLLKAGQIEAARSVLAQGQARGLRGPSVDDLARRLMTAVTSPFDTALLLPLSEQQALIALLELGCFAEVEASARHLVQRYPQDVFGWKILGTALAKSKQSEAALQVLQKALGMNPHDPDIHNSIGIVFVNLLQLERAMSCYRQALALNPDYTEAHNNLASMFINFGQLDEARLHIDHALRVSPGHIEAQCLLTDLQKADRDDPAFVLLAQALSPEIGLGSMRRQIVNFALGKMYADIGEYDKAFEYYAIGNGLRTANQSKPYDHEVVRSRLAFVRGMFTREYFAERTDWGTTSNLPIFIIGMPRSGTSLVEQILASHTQVHGAGELQDLSQLLTRVLANKTHLESDNNLNEFNKNDAITLAEAYLQRLRTLAPGAHYVTDKLPHNFERLWLIALIFPRATVLHSVRNPVDTCLSCYFQDFIQGHAWKNDLRTLAQHYNFYQELMAHWQAVLPITIHSIVYEDLVSDPDTQIPHLLNICGLDFEPTCLEFHHTQRPIKTASATQVTQKMYTSSVEKWRCYERHLGPLLETLNLTILRDWGIDQIP